jgi:hypothetical protein
VNNFIIQRLSEPGSAAKLAIFRIIICGFALWYCQLEIARYQSYIGAVHSLNTIFPTSFNLLTSKFLIELNYLIKLFGFLTMIGFYFKISSKMFFIVFLLYWNGMYHLQLVHGAWPYLLFPLFVLSFSKASDCFSYDSWVNKTKILDSRSPDYRWPFELIIFMDFFNLCFCWYR